MMNDGKIKLRRAVILAAGKGRRLETLQLNKPKPAIVVGGKPLIVRHLEYCSKCGINEVFINLHYLPEQIRSLVGDGSEWNLKVTYNFEPILLGTAGGVKGLAQYLRGGPFLVIYGDNYLTFSPNEIIDQHFALSFRPDMSIALFELEDISGSGVAVCDENNLVQAFLEKPRAGVTGSHLVNAGVYVMEPELLDLIPGGTCDFGHDFIPFLLLSKKRILGVRTKNRVYAIDTPELLHRVSTKTDLAHGDGVADKSNGA
jgi:NDP-sugar pyrophosphorylase family protein